MAVGLGALVVLASIGGLQHVLAPTARAAEARSPTQRVIEDLVYANRILAAKGIVDGFGHVSARSPTNPGRFYMARSLAPALVTAADILEYDLTGEPVQPTSQRLYSERFIHAATYKARPDAKAVLHSHSAEILPFSIAGSRTPLRAVIHDGAFLGERVPVYDANSDGSNGGLLVSNMKLADDMAAKLAGGAVLLIRGHGEVVVGRDPAEVTTRAIYVDKNARALKEAVLLGGPVSYLAANEIAERARLAAAYTEGRDWELLKAEVDDVTGGAKRPR